MINIIIESRTPEGLIKDLKDLIGRIQPEVEDYLLLARTTTEEERRQYRDGKYCSLRINLNTDNAAFSELPYGDDNDWEEVRNTPANVAFSTEVTRILNEVVERVSQEFSGEMHLRDINGNKVGWATWNFPSTTH